MEVVEVELRRIRLPLVTPFRASFGTESERDILLVKVTTDQAEGWGECVALGAPTYTPEYVDGAHAVLAAHLIPAVFAAPCLSAEAVGSILSTVKGHRMAKAALETAVLDAELRATGRSLGSFLGAVRDEVDAGVSVGLMDSTDELLDAVALYLEQGYRRIKLKIEPGRDVVPVRAVRERFGDEVRLQVDANASYRINDAAHLAELDPFDLLLIEQPLPEDDIAGHALLATLIRTPVCLDESIESARDATEAIAAGACAIVNIKPGRVGGYFEARRIHDVCASHEVPVWCGGMLETGIGRAANVALAALPNFTLPGDLSASDRYYQQDITAPFQLLNGKLSVPRGPGIGVEPDPDILASVTTSCEHLSKRTTGT